MVTTIQSTPTIGHFSLQQVVFGVLVSPRLYFIVLYICRAHDVLTELKSSLLCITEQAFEVYAPGVVEAVSGYSGPNCIDNPSYKNHPGCYEVILIEYDPLQTTYKLMLDYAWRNIDPYNGNGQFCDRGPSYFPGIFYATEEERVAAEQVKEEILEEYGWDESTLQVPLVERPKFWTAIS